MSRLCALALIVGFAGTASADNLIYSNGYGGYWNGYGGFGNGYGSYWNGYGGYWNYGATPCCCTSAYPYSLGYCGPTYGSFGYPYTPGYSWSSYSTSYYHPYR